MLKISEIVKKTREMFDLFNEHFYDNKLNRPAITVSPDGGSGAYGWWRTLFSVYSFPYLYGPEGMQK